MTIRQATITDAPVLQKLNDEFFGERRDYTVELQSSTTMIYLCEHDGDVCGITGIKLHNWNNTAWIFNVFVLPDFRRKGIGTQMIERMVKEAKRFGVRCVLAEAPSNGNAPALFTACGFRKCGYNDRYYTNDGSEIAEFYAIDM